MTGRSDPFGAFYRTLAEIARQPSPPEARRVYGALIATIVLMIGALLVARAAGWLA